MAVRLHHQSGGIADWSDLDEVEAQLFRWDIPCTGLSSLICKNVFLLTRRVRNNRTLRDLFRSGAASIEVRDGAVVVTTQSQFRAASEKTLRRMRIDDKITVETASTSGELPAKPR